MPTVPVPASTVRENAMQALKALLVAQITQARRVTRYSSAGQLSGDLPIIRLNELADQNLEDERRESPHGAVTHLLQVRAEVVVSGKDDPEAFLNYFLGMLHKAAKVDPQLGGTVIDTVVTDSDSDVSEDRQQGSLRATVAIKYRHLFGDPFTAV